MKSEPVEWCRYHRHESFSPVACVGSSSTSTDMFVFGMFHGNPFLGKIGRVWVNHEPLPSRGGSRLLRTRELMPWGPDTRSRPKLINIGKSANVK
ncbi:hypothetical protein KQX54_020499 [Cotesia glomerata]|uniref:Uncharacterized protein n=1 Tax=Cotesia glomerata TaxID=32391 RepID=A0AAV7J7T6_COTGL|nr:hypothetical protein KQX54_020499 [Cotesia glomerata]